MATNSEFNVTISELIKSHCEEGWESFSVIMSCSEPVNQGTIELFHEQLGSTILFVSPKSEQEIEVVISNKV